MQSTAPHTLLRRWLLLGLLPCLLLGSTPQVVRAEGFEVGGDTKFNRNNGPKNEPHRFLSTSEWAIQRDNRDDAPQVSGKVSLSCYADDKDDFLLDLDGLKPATRYTVWLVSSLRAGAERAGIGPEPFAATTNDKGHLHLGAPLTKCPLAAYRWIEVREHADGKVTNLDNSVRVARARMIGE
jgi:hypothetical protein